jgi:hypothetical protein
VKTEITVMWPQAKELKGAAPREGVQPSFHFSVLASRTVQSMLSGLQATQFVVLLWQPQETGPALSSHYTLTKGCVGPVAHLSAH